MSVSECLFFLKTWNKLKNWPLSYPTSRPSSPVSLWSSSRPICLPVFFFCQFCIFRQTSYLPIYNFVRVDLRGRPACLRPHSDITASPPLTRAIYFPIASCVFRISLLAAIGKRSFRKCTWPYVNKFLSQGPLAPHKQTGCDLFIPGQVALLEGSKKVPTRRAGMQKTEVVFIYTHGQNWNQMARCLSMWSIREM